MGFIEEEWTPLSFTVPAMSVDIHTVDKVTKKKVKKRDASGNVLSDERIIPKERPRSARTKRGKVVVYSSENTVNFEKWIRTNFFNKYKGSVGTYYKGKPIPVHSIFLGCREYGEKVPCAKYRQGRDFLDCQVCSYRRRNLALTLDVFLKDDRHIDLDNVCKIVLDALNKVCFYDDNQFIYKELKLNPYAEEERLEIKMGVLQPHFHKGSLGGVYPIKTLPIKQASEYIKGIATEIQTRSLDDFFSYLRRCDKRKYVEGVIAELDATRKKSMETLKKLHDKVGGESKNEPENSTA